MFVGLGSSLKEHRSSQNSDNSGKTPVYSLIHSTQKALLSPCPVPALVPLTCIPTHGSNSRSINFARHWANFCVLHLSCKPAGVAGVALCSLLCISHTLSWIVQPQDFWCRGHGDPVPEGRGALGFSREPPLNSGWKGAQTGEVHRS
jgi:hypothetical protein